MTTPVFLQIKELLDTHKVQYMHLTHEHVHTSSDAAAKIRGTNIEDGAKAIIMKAQLQDGTYQFIQGVISANERIDLKKVKNILKSKNVALASPDEVLEKTGCTIGSVPPFGNLFDIPVFIDKSILSREKIVFSAGSHTDSMQMNPQDYLKIVNGKIVDIRRE